MTRSEHAQVVDDQAIPSHLSTHGQQERQIAAPLFLGPQGNIERASVAAGVRVCRDQRNRFVGQRNQPAVVVTNRSRELGCSQSPSAAVGNCPRSRSSCLFASLPHPLRDGVGRAA